MNIIRTFGILLAVLYLSLSAHATTWYATGSSNINTTSLWVPTSTGSCTGSGTALVWGAQANGDTFDANGCTVVINANPGSVSVQVTLTTDATQGGEFTLTMTECSTLATIYANVTATKTAALAISGATASVSCTISGNITGGSSSAAYGLINTVSASSSTLTVSGNVTGGSVGTAYGVYGDGAGAMTITGSVASGGVVNGFGYNGNSSGNTTISGSCVGSNAAATSYGCNQANTGAITLTGNIVNGILSQGVVGRTYYAPAAATNYILSPANSSYTLGTVNANATETPVPPAVANVLSGVNYGTYTGIASTGGTTIVGGGIAIF